jgi:hypothetical protein
MKKITEKDSYINEINKNDVLEVLLDNHVHFLGCLMEQSNNDELKQTIKNFLYIMEHKHEHLKKLNKIF